MSDPQGTGKLEEASKAKMAPPPQTSDRTPKTTPAAAAPTVATPQGSFSAPTAAPAPFTESVTAPLVETTVQPTTAASTSASLPPVVKPEVIIHPEVSVIVSPSPDPVPDAGVSPSPSPLASAPKAPEVKKEISKVDMSRTAAPTVVTVTPAANSVSPPKSEPQKTSQKTPAQKTGNLQAPADVGPPGTPTKQAESKMVEHPPESTEGSEPSQSKVEDLTKGEEKAIAAVNAFKTGLFRRKLVELKLVSQNALHERTNEEDNDGTGEENEEYVDDRDEVLNTRIKFISGFLLAIALIIMIAVQANTLFRVFSIDTTAKDVEVKARILQHDVTIARIGLQTSDPGFPDPRVECTKENGRLKMDSRRCYHQYTPNKAKSYWEAVEFCEARGYSLTYARNEDELHEIGAIFRLNSGFLVLGVYGDEYGRLLTVDSAREFQVDFPELTVPGGDWTDLSMCLKKKQGRITLTGSGIKTSVEKCAQDAFENIICMTQF